MSSSPEARVIAVAGGAGNLGPTVVSELARDGRRVCACGRDRESLEALAAEVDGEIDIDVVDLLDADATRAWAAELASASRPRRRARPPRRRLARRDADRGSPARGLGLPRAAARPDAPARDAGLRAVPPRERPRPGRRHLDRPGAGADAHERRRTRPARRPRRRGRSRSPTASAGRARPRTSSSSARSSPRRCAPRARTRTSPDSRRPRRSREAIAYLCSDAAASMNGQRLVLRGAF